MAVEQIPVEDGQGGGVAGKKRLRRRSIGEPGLDAAGWEAEVPYQAPEGVGGAAGRHSEALGHARLLGDLLWPLQLDHGGEQDRRGEAMGYAESWSQLPAHPVAPAPS